LKNGAELTTTRSIESTVGIFTSQKEI